MPVEDLSKIISSINHECRLHPKDDSVKKRGKRYTSFKQCLIELSLIAVDNPISQEYFRSLKSVRQEKKRQQDNYAFVIHPLSKFRLWYELWQFVLFLLLLIIKPLNSSLFGEVFIAENPSYVAFEMIMEFVTWIDIVMTFFTGYIKRSSKTIELRHSRIAWNYVYGPYFFCDIFSAIPVNLVYGLFHPPNKMLLGVLNSLAWLKIVRLVSLVQLIHRIVRYLKLKTKRKPFLIDSVILTIVIVHWMACLQYGVPKYRTYYFVEEEKTDTWKHFNKLFEMNYRRRYVHCFFRASAFILGVSIVKVYTLEKPDEYILAIVTYLLGKIVVACLWIILAVSILNARSVEIKFFEMMNQLEEYMYQKKLPPNVKKRITDYYDFKYQKRYFKEASIEWLLTDNIKQDVHMHLSKSLIAKVSLFSDLDPEEVSEMAVHLIPEIFLPNDTIIQSGAFGDAMYFLSSGTVAVYTTSGKEVCHIEDGEYFGEIELVLKNRNRKASIIAIETSHVFRLPKRDFDRCLMKNKQVLNRIIQRAEERFKETLRIEDDYKRKLFEVNIQKK